MKWWVRLRLQVPVSPLWKVEERKVSLHTTENAAQLSSEALYDSKRSIIKQHVKHVTAMLLCRHGAEGWCENQGDPLAPLPTL
jgi:hypothetical protein